MIRSRVRFVDRLVQIERIIVAHRGVDANGVPLVTVADVLELVETWTVAVCDVLGVDGLLGEVASQWDEFATSARSVAEQRAVEGYHPDRRGVFAALRRLAVSADQADGNRIAEAFAAGWRNATVSASATAGELDITNVKDWVDLLGALAGYLRSTRGAVSEPNPSPGRSPRQYPQTTVAEVLAIADFWTQRLGELGRDRRDGTDAAIAAWRRVVVDTTNTAKGLKADSTYPKDWEFWDALCAFVAAIDRARAAAVKPTWRLHLDASAAEPPGPPDILQSAMHEIGDAAQAVVQGVQNAASAALRSVQGAATGAVQDVMHSVEDATRSAVKDAAKDVAADAASGAKEALARIAKPVAIGGAVVLGALLLVPALARRH